MFDKAFGSLEKGMRISAEKQAVHSHNIANINTPGYQALEFDEELNRAVTKQDRQKVVLEEEMARLSENSTRYSAYVKLLSQKINILKTIATQGRK